MDWLVYIIHCTDGSLYTGITNDLANRLQQHTAGKGAKYFRGRKRREEKEKEELTRQMDLFP